MRYVMLVDTVKCIGCSDCVIACSYENQIPLENSTSWIVESVKGEYPQTTLSFRSERCNHCENIPCVRCCPTNASYVAEGGIVLVDANKCIGCGACVESCPYDARFMHPDGYADKCTFCHHRVVEDKLPACVGVCPTSCLHFGDIENKNSEVNKLLAKRKYYTLIPEAGTKPQVYYLT